MSEKHGLLWGAVALAMAAALGGCQPKASPNEAAASPRGIALAGPAYQHRTFDAGDKEKTLRAVVATLQDLDFIIGKVDMSRGTPVLAASTVNAGGAFGLAVIVWQKSPQQAIVRAYATQGTKLLENPGYYQSFFDALSRTLSLPAHTDAEENAAASAAPPAPAPAAPAPAAAQP